VSLTENLDLFDPGGAQQEGAFDADPMGSDPADGEVGIVSALAQADHCAAEFLYPLAVALPDSDMNTHRVTGPQLRDIRIGRGLH